MKTNCPPGYHHNCFVATHALGHIYNTQLLCQHLEDVSVFVYLSV